MLENTKKRYALFGAFVIEGFSLFLGLMNLEAKVGDMETILTQTILWWIVLGAMALNGIIFLVINHYWEGAFVIILTVGIALRITTVEIEAITPTTMIPLAMIVLIYISQLRLCDESEAEA